MKDRLIGTIVAIFISMQSWQATANDFVDQIGAEEWAELYQIVWNINVSCADKVFTNWEDLADGVRAIVVEIAGGAVAVSAEYLTSLAFKKDYPNACHVMSKEHLRNVTADKETKKGPCLLHKPTGGCMVREMRTFTEYSYYWPKYFIEVSEKGNDPHPAFAEGNALYTANRKVAHMFESLIDVKGPFVLAGKVIGGASLVEAGTKTVFDSQTQGFNFNVSAKELAEASKTAILTPLEKLRIRANKESTQPSYDVNIWPVGLSKTFAENFSVCGDGNPSTDEGGFSWPIPGVAQTCPVAMSRDAWSYWDSGFIDYLNPNAVRGILSAANPITCAADNMTGIAFDNYASKGFSGAMGDSGTQDNKNAQIAKMPDLMQGLRYCSFPILGDAEAIYRQYANTLNTFAGPWCTMWGSMVPRYSSSSYQNDYSFVNSALKFKSLAHDIFGNPRGNKERWALAYPWEDSTGGILAGGVGMGKYLGKLKTQIFGNKPPKIVKSLFEDKVGRSRLLAVPGDPRLVDFALNPVDDAKNLAKEIAYLASLKIVSSEAEKAAIDAMKKDNNVSGPTTSEEILGEQDKLVREAEDVTALEDEEEVWEYQTFCHVAAEKKGLVFGGPDEFQVNYHGYVTGRNSFSFGREDSQARCHGHDVGHCLGRDWKGKCKHKRKGQLIFYRRLVKTGTIKVQHPRIFRIDRGECSVNHSETATKKRDFVVCEDRQVEVDRRDTREYVDRPDKNNPGSIVKENSDTARAAGLAAKTAVWVGAELARNKYQEISGHSLLPGKKRVYTIFEEVKCKPDFYVSKVGPVTRYERCSEAIRYEIKRWIHTKLLRRACDNIFNSKLGEPFK